MVVEKVWFVASLTVTITVPTVVGIMTCVHVEECARMNGPAISEKEDVTEPELEDVVVGLASVAVPFSAVFLGSRAVSLRFSRSDFLTHNAEQ
jgi:hypothetical protein